ncbi:GDNF-inducible zinc finger protein 1 [Phyllopteryx taeniolatus]|uniref:GDNF-inducible zinc finger protein 1 n=1 Tax=Phyllopteryx taeniolatus TaxID=161469 RepID=UPI002AD4FCC1|nr:GDNF-inducible zinc finger protein 1 [Phyllopteryx taeniolatus]XP_061609024.1 GDNF-inducible zinc finger protein 1 [Phyllopteryx taeniolatus]XP_061609025.1 GDNF-inducible zinc finger protein 1 [Phyllopteryx taeniolatus]
MMGMAVVQLTSQSHHQKLLNALYHLRLQGHLSDITVQVDYQGHSQAFQAHRVVLAASSGYFRNILLSQDSTTDHIPLSNMLPSDFSDFLEFAYTGKAEVAQSRIADVQAAAKILDCEDLARVCGENCTSRSDAVDELSPVTKTGRKKTPLKRQPAPKSSERLSKRPKVKTTKLKMSLGGRKVLQRSIPTRGKAFNAEEQDDYMDTPSPTSPHFDKDMLSLSEDEEPLLLSPSEDEEECVVESKRPSKFLCNECQRSFHYERSYLKHMSTYHGVKADLVFRCETCLKTFSNRSNLRIHEKHVHSSERHFTCKVCTKTFKRKKDVVRHHKQVHEPRLHECSDCGKSLSSKASLMLHKRTHSGIKAFVCTDCGARFTQKSALKMHHRIHTGEKPFACDVCDARFTQKSLLAYHKRSHTGEKPFMCEACGKSFASKEYLRYHSNIHTGSKPFKCEQCGRGFAQRNSLRQHLTVHTGARPYACTYCDKHFTQLNALQRHQRIHTGEKPYMCGLCNRTFTDKSTLRRHTTTHDANAPWKNYLVVLEGNVEEKKPKAQSKAAAPLEKKNAAKKASKSNITSTADTAALVVPTGPVNLPPEPVAPPHEWAGPGAITLVSHGHMGGITVIHAEMPPGTQVVRSDGGNVIALDGPFTVPVGANPSETGHSLPADTPTISSLLEEDVSQTILAPKADAAQPDIQTVVVSDEMCKDAQMQQRTPEWKGDNDQANS